MGKIFHLSSLILCAVFSQEMVAAFEENAELSSVLHRRQKRMNSEPGSSSALPSNLPPRFEDLKKVNLENPSLVSITTIDNSTKPGYAIHPYFILTRLVYTIQGFRVFVPMRDSPIPQRQPVRACLGEASGQIVLIQLTNPITMDYPVHRPFSAEHYPTQLTDWAKHKVQVWIHGKQPHFRPQPQQSLNEMRLYDPTRVVMTHYGKPIGHGFAIHPFIVVANLNFVHDPVGVSSYTETAGELKIHRVKNFLIHADIGLVRLRNPVPLTVPVPAAFVTEDFSMLGLTWVEVAAREWKHDILNG